MERPEPRLTANALTVLEKRYLLKDEAGKVRESPAQLFERVARTMAQIESKNKNQWSDRFYELMASRRFIPNSPTLMNAGKKGGQLSACFVLPIQDSLDSIFDTLKYAAKIHQSGGGTGFSFSSLRPSGSLVRSTLGVASGPVSFMRIFDIATETIKQGGTRRGANMAVLRVDHPDVLEFVESKADQRSITNFNISVGATDEFMRSVREESEFWLKDPRTLKPVQKVKAKELFSRIVKSAWSCGDPGLVFLDRMNRFNPTPQVGEFESTNPCVTGDTRVYVAGEGLVPIQELVGKTPSVMTEMRETGSEQNRGEFRRASQVMRTGIRPVYRLKTREGYGLRLTGDHRVMTDEGDIPCKDLRVGDQIRLLEIVPPQVRRESKDARWGEGIGSWTGNGPSVVCMEGQRIYRELQDRGIDENCKVRVPEMVWRGTPDLVAGYLRGLFSSFQGFVVDGASPRLVSVHLRILEEIQVLLLHLGMKSALLRNQRRRILPVSQDLLGGEDPGAEHELVISEASLPIFADRIGFLDAEMQQQLERVLISGQAGLNRNPFFATVTEIVLDGTEDVYDLTEPSSSHFHANGILVHNCGEQPLLPFESCNLGSLNLGEYYQRNEFDWKQFRTDIAIATRFLDNVIDANDYPVPECEKITLRNRKIGLGVMGFADLLMMMGLSYSSPEAIEWGERLMSIVDREAKRVSMLLAKERGAFPNWKGSLWQKLGYKPLRNATVSTIAPTGTISMIAGASSGIEPLFSGVFYRNVLDGERLVEIHPAIEKLLRARGLDLKSLTDERISQELGPVWSPSRTVPIEIHVRMQAAFQRHSDSAVSKTINLPQQATEADVARAYWLAFDLGCKGITVYRDRSRPSQVLDHPETIEEASDEVCLTC